ncbi:hypothetical protein R9C00_11425 [Flammeovirgaceae bacterium SG7u.111]|nr:hypothetical protein [Flammeovirgaceae bacterium SG7u.132]WPO38062.1 hypothetical protein R9C00_11425 [Flammeovirgaceae bacterium SG7u.111]
MKSFRLVLLFILVLHPYSSSVGQVLRFAPDSLFSVESTLVEDEVASTYATEVGLKNAKGKKLLKLKFAKGRLIDESTRSVLGGVGEKQEDLDAFCDYAHCKTVLLLPVIKVVLKLDENLYALAGYNRIKSPVTISKQILIYDSKKRKIIKRVSYLGNRASLAFSYHKEARLLNIFGGYDRSRIVTNGIFIVEDDQLSRLGIEKKKVSPQELFNENKPDSFYQVDIPSGRVDSRIRPNHTDPYCYQVSLEY